MKKDFRQIISVISVCCTAVKNFIEHSWGGIFFIVLFTVLRIVIGIDRGVWANYSPHDDLLFVQQARHIVSGEWLGPFNFITTAKSSVYPAFIALSVASGIPYLMVLDIFLCGTMYLGVQAMRPCLDRFWGLLLYIVLIFNPAFFLSQRLLIQDFFTILIAGQIFCLIACWMRRNQEFGKSIPWIIANGLFFALAAHTREEGNVFCCGVFAWIYVFLLADALFSKHKDRKSIIRSTLFFILIPAVCFFSIKWTICAINKHCYGKFETCMRNSRTYKGFIGSLLGAAKCLDPVWDIRIPLRYDVLDRLYELSPSLKTLKPYIKRESFWHGIPNARFPEKVLKADPNLAANTKGGFVQWELLDAMQQAGYSSGGNRVKSEIFFRNVVRELEEAAAQGKIPGFKPRYSNLVPWSKQMADQFIFKFRRDAETLYLWNVKFLDRPSLDFSRRNGNILNRFMIDCYFAPVKSPEILNRNFYLVNGWGFFPSDKQVIQSHNFSDSPVFYYQSVSRPDVQAYLKSKGYPDVQKNSGFRLLLQGKQIKIKNNSNQYVLDTAILPRPKNGMINIDSVSELKAVPSIRNKRIIMRKICQFFQITGKYISFLAAAILILGILSSSRRKLAWSKFLDLYLPGIILWGSGFVYFCMIIFANVMLHCPRNSLYYLPAFVLIYAGCWSVIIAGCTLATALLRRDTPGDSTTPR